MFAPLDSPFHVKAAWVLPLSEDTKCKMLLVDGKKAIADECEVLLKSNSDKLHRINLIGSPSVPEGKEDTDATKSDGNRRLALLTSITNRFDSCHSLTVLKIKGFPLVDDNGYGIEGVKNVCHALRTSRSIQHLSLDECSLGDSGCIILCSTLATCPTVATLSLQGNNLTKDSAAGLAVLLEKQELVRGLTWWKRSLRNRQVDPDSLLGLKRITLNNNPSISDEGIHLIVESLYDDFWIKAVDMQSCGITENGALEVVKLLKVNKGIHVFDLRNNKDVSLYGLRSIMHTLLKNVGSNLSETKWLSCDSPSECTLTSRTNKVKKGKKRPQTSMYPRSKNVEMNQALLDLKRTFSTRIPPRKCISTSEY